jgi:hypothetical protein
MASSLDPVTPAGNSPVVPTITSQVQEDLPSLAEARQLEQLMGAKPNLWRRLQDFSGSSQMRTCFLFLPPAAFALYPLCHLAGGRSCLLQFL